MDGWVDSFSGTVYRSLLHLLSDDTHFLKERDLHGSRERSQIANITGSNSTDSCTLLVDDVNLTDGKIPQVLGIAVSVWLVLTLVFLLMRYFASDYSRAGLATSSQYMISLTSHTKLDDNQKRRSLSLSTMLYEDKHWYTWLINFFYRLRESDIRHRCGPDATLYLSLQSHIILLLTVFSIISIAIMLPVNYLGGHLASPGFPRTTITNIEPSSGVLWIYTILSLVYLVITIIFMVHYSLQLGKQQQNYSNHSVMVQWIPSVVHREDILQHLQESLPGCPVADVQLAYDTGHLVSLNKELSKVAVKLDEVDSIRNDLGIRENVRVGWKKICCCCQSYNIDAKTYYEIMYRDLSEAIEKEKGRVKEHKKLGIGFITFGLENDAKKFCNSYKLCRQKPQSSVYNDLKAGWWWVSTAAFPLDIIWENLSMPYVIWWIRWLIINAVLLVFVFFFTTPSILITGFNQLRVIFANFTHIPDVTELNTSSHSLATLLFSNLLLLFFAFLLPFIVSRSSYLETHWTKSLREQTIMRKTYIFLLLMLIILPSIGLASLNAFAELTKEKNFPEILQSRLKCVFLPNNGAFFVGYIITSTFIGCSIKLLRLPELALYTLRRCRSRTRLQRELSLKTAANYEFRYGVEYAWNLVIFNMVVSFSLTTPLIVPFGVLYFILTYYTDRYNIYYVYRAAPFNGRQFLHRSAVNFVIVGAMHLQLSTLFFSVIRLGRVDPRSVIMMVTFALTCVICIGIMFLGWFKHLLPRLRIKMGKEYHIFGSSQGSSPSTSLDDSEDDTEEVIVKGSYIPPVLRETPQLDSPTETSGSSYGYQSFGSTDRMGRRNPSNSPTNNHNTLTLTHQPTASTLERSAIKSKPSSGGGVVVGPGTCSMKKKGELSPTKEKDPKSFV